MSRSPAQRKEETARPIRAALAEHARAHPEFHYHYVSAREMYNLVRAAEAGWTGSVAGARDFELLANLAAPAATPAPMSVS